MGVLNPLGVPLERRMRSRMELVGCTCNVSSSFRWLTGLVLIPLSLLGQGFLLSHLLH